MAGGESGVTGASPTTNSTTYGHVRTVIMRKNTQMPGKLPTLAFAAVLCCAAPFNAHAQPTLSLDEAVSLALDHSRRLQGATLETERAGQQIAAAKTQRLPQIKVTAFAGELLNHPTLTFAKGVFGTLPDGSPVPVGAVRLRAPERPLAIPFVQGTFPLSQQYRTALDVKKLTVEQRMKVEESRGARTEVIAAVKDHYYRLLLSQFSLNTAERNVSLYKELERITLQYVSEKAALKTDLLDVQARRARTEYDALVIRDRILKDKEELNSLLGRPVDEDFGVTPTGQVDTSVPELAELRAQAMAANPTVRQARLRVESAEVAKRIKRSEYIPDVSLSVNYLAVPGVPSIFPQRFVVAGAYVDWQPFDWGRKRHELAELSRSQQETVLALKDEEDRVCIAVGVQLRKLVEARHLLTAAQINEERAQEEVRVMQVRYSQNATLLKSVIESQAAASAGNEQTQRALTEWWEAQTSLDRL